MDRIYEWKLQPKELEGYESYSLELSSEKLITLGYSEIEGILITLFEGKKRNHATIVDAVGKDSEGIAYLNGTDINELRCLRETIKNAKGLPKDKNRELCDLLDEIA
jgi:hypothetical protein